MKEITVIIIWAVLVALLIWDIYAINHSGVEASISWVIYQQARRHPAISFGLGFICGHLLWPIIAPP